MPGFESRLYECTVRGVHEDDRVIDVISRGGTPFKNLSYLLPWISAKGSGIDFVPKTDDTCLVLATPEPKRTRGAPRAGGVNRGRYAICIGFKLPVTPGAGGLELGGRRPGLAQGSVCLRAVSESGDDAQLLLTRGGTALLSINDTCRTLYSPVDSSITHFFDSWHMVGPGGSVAWTRKDATNEVTYLAEYQERVGGATGMCLNVKIGGPDTELSPVTVDVFDVDRGSIERPYLRVRVTRDGEAFVEGESIHILGRAGVNIDGAQVKIKGRQVLGQGDPI